MLEQSFNTMKIYGYKKANTWFIWRLSLQNPHKYQEKEWNFNVVKHPRFCSPATIEWLLEQGIYLH